jgi:ketosteroid isomerase-like protein
MSQENVEIVRSIYEAINRRDWDAAFRDADPEFALTTQRGPEAGTRRGREAVVALAEEYNAIFDKLIWDPEEFFERADQVAVFVSIRSRPRGGGVDLVIQNGHLWTFRDGVALSLESFPERESALVAAGLPE